MSLSVFGVPAHRKAKEEFRFDMKATASCSWQQFYGRQGWQRGQQRLNFVDRNRSTGQHEQFRLGLQQRNLFGRALEEQSIAKLERQISVPGAVGPPGAPNGEHVQAVFLAKMSLAQPLPQERGTRG
jgi:hypothetical protein